MLIIIPSSLHYRMTIHQLSQVSPPIEGDLSKGLRLFDEALDHLMVSSVHSSVSTPTTSCSSVFDFDEVTSISKVLSLLLFLAFCLCLGVPTQPLIWCPGPCLNDKCYTFFLHVCSIKYILKPSVDVGFLSLHLKCHTVMGLSKVSEVSSLS